jgi:hypothetical protein
VDIATGATLQTIALPSDSFGATYGYYSGLQVAPSALTLNGVAVPAGSLLLFNGWPSPDLVTAINPTTGAAIATLTLEQNYDLTAGVFDPTSGHLFVADRRGGANQLVEINPANGAEMASFALPFGFDSAGLALDPVSGNIWYGSNRSASVVELSRTGAVLRTVDLTAQGVDQISISGLSFDAKGKLYAASTQGVVYKVDLAFDPAVKRPTLTAVNALAASGVAANAAQASANIGQVIELTGSNFGANTQVVFNTRDNAGKTSVAAQTPLAINAAGTRLQVIVPDLATTGDIKVVNTGFGANLGFNGYPDAIYRNVTLSFTPSSSTATLRFADNGLEDIRTRAGVSTTSG